MNNNNNNFKMVLDKYIGYQVDNAIEQLKSLYPNFEFVKTDEYSCMTMEYVYNRIRVRHNDQFIVTSVTQG
jgi:hypothetical protein